MRSLLPPNRKHFLLVFKKCSSLRQVAGTALFTSRFLPIEQGGPGGHYPDTAHLYGFPSCHRNDTGWKSPKPISLNIKPQPNPHDAGRNSRREPGDAKPLVRPLARCAAEPGCSAPGWDPHTLPPRAPTAPGPHGTSRPVGAAGGRCSARRRRGSHGNPRGPAGSTSVRTGERGRAGLTENPPGREGPAGEGKGSDTKEWATPVVPSRPLHLHEPGPGAAPVLAHPQWPCLRCDPEQGNDELLPAHSSTNV